MLDNLTYILDTFTSLSENNNCMTGLENNDIQVQTKNPMDIYTDESGTIFIDAAMVGKNKSDIKITTRQSIQKAYNVDLVVETLPAVKDDSNDSKDKVDEEPDVPYDYIIKKIKYFNQPTVITLSDKFDFKKLSAKMSNGLLKIVIPIKIVHEQKEIEIDID